MGLELHGVTIPYSLWKKAKYGEGIIIANLDTGVWPESKNFSDEGYGPDPSKWKGACPNNTDDGVRCNKKLIGAKVFTGSYIQAENNLTKEQSYPRDYEGHGFKLEPSKVVLQELEWLQDKICFPKGKDGGGCYYGDALKAFNEATKDEVDVISFSVGGDLTDYFNDAFALGAFEAIKKGIVVVCFAGNNGTFTGSVTNVAPWILTVCDMRKSFEMGLGKIVTKLNNVRSFPDKKRFGEENLASSGEMSRCIRLDMGDSVNDKKRQPNNGAHSSLKHEILQLEKRLQNQFEVRGALEKALGYRASSQIHNDVDEMEIPKPATELIKEIAVLELEVVYLEQYLLSLYRKAFDQQATSVSPPTKNERSKSALTTPRARFIDFSGLNVESSAVKSDSLPLDNSRKEFNNNKGEDRLLDSSVNRCHSSLPQRSVFSNRKSPPQESFGKTIRACHSQPLSMAEYAQDSETIISLAEHLGTRISDHVPEAPNKLAEDMIKCMSTIYCKLVEPSSAHNGLSSPNSSLSSTSLCSPREQYDMWNNSSFDVQLDNPFHVEGLKEFSGPYSTMVEVPCINRDSKKLGDVEHLLQNFKSLICRLEQINPKKLTHEEKLAFWINIHNALVMHAYLAYGVPQNNVKRLFLLLKASYNIGGQTFSAETIRNSILGCRMSRPGQWLRLLLLSKTKFKSGDERQAYSIQHPEPLLHFAICSGNHSDPAVRIYTPKRIYQELEDAKEEYLRATFGVRKDQKVILPKIVESFAKDAGLCSTGVLEMVQQSLPDSFRKSIKKCQGKSGKTIEWIPHNFTFRYLISKELVK
ncbi:hypothetical protein ACFE04_001317 [Oxalis oulophora]